MTCQLLAYAFGVATKASTELGLKAWHAFHRIRITLLPPLVKHLSEECGLTEAEYQVFIGLESAEHKQLKPSQLAEALGWDLPRLSHQVSRMEARGLLAKQQCPHDARSCWVGITKKGRDIFLKALPVQTKEVERLFAHALTPEQMRNLIEISEAIEAHVQRESTR